MTSEPPLEDSISEPTGPDQPPPPHVAASAAAPGWYPVPGGQMYWDGGQWTGQVAPMRSADDDKLLCVLAHLLSFVSSILAPLILYLIKRKDSPAVRHHAAQSFNFDVTVTIVGVALMVVLAIGAIAELWILVVLSIIGFFVIGIGAVVLKIIATMAASRGELYEYPFTPKMLR